MKPPQLSGEVGALGTVSQSQSLDDRARALNPAQTQAVQAGDGPVIVLAGPGSGKTRVLTHRIAHLIHQCGVPPYRILAVTFTNKAAREMVSRLDLLIGEETRRLMIGTFHAVCVRILRREASHIGIKSSFVIFDADDQRRLVARLIKDLDLDSNQYRPSSVHGAISRAKNELFTSMSYVPPTYWHEGVARVFARYEHELTANGALDFDDLLLKTEQLLREHADVRRRYQERFRHILVDEFQDTNKAQYALVCHLAGRSRNVFVVGDEDQSIYSWRGADFRNVRRFRQDFPNTQVHLLEQNYRSTQVILDAAQAVIAENRQRTAKKLWTANGRGQLIRVFEAYDEREEAEYVVQQVRELIADGTCQARDCAVMFRTNAQSRALEDAFLRHGLQYRLVGATRFYQRREIKDVLSYLRLLLNPDDEIALMRAISTPRRGIGPQTLAELSNWATQEGLSLGAALLQLYEMHAQQGSIAQALLSPRSGKLLLRFASLLSGLASTRDENNLSQLLKMLLERTGYVEMLMDGTEEGKDRTDNVKELFTAIKRFDQLPASEALPVFLAEVSLATDVDQTDWQVDAVTLMTLHAAKGLEFDTVFIIGMEEGICPHARSADDPDQMEEERRLCYVGITRAQRRLYLIRAFRRTIFGDSDVRQPSRFLGDIPSGLISGTTGLESRGVGRGSQSVASKAGRQSYRDLFTRRRARAQRLRDSACDTTWEASGDQRAPAGANYSRPSLSGHGKQAEVAPHDGPHKPLAALEIAFHPGESVSHPLFGSGTVVASKLVGGDEEVAVAFEGRGVKRLMASYARLEKN